MILNVNNHLYGIRSGWSPWSYNVCIVREGVVRRWGQELGRAHLYCSELAQVVEVAAKKFKGFIMKISDSWETWSFNIKYENWLKIWKQFWTESTILLLPLGYRCAQRIRRKRGFLSMLGRKKTWQRRWWIVWRLVSKLNVGRQSKKWLVCMTGILGRIIISPRPVEVWRGGTCLVSRVSRVGTLSAVPGKRSGPQSWDTPCPHRETAAFWHNYPEMGETWCKRGLSHLHNSGNSAA